MLVGWIASKGLEPGPFRAVALAEVSQRNTGCSQHNEEQNALGHQGMNLGIRRSAGGDQDQAQDIPRQADGEQGAQIA